jgi:hypothetical protein
MIIFLIYVFRCVTLGLMGETFEWKRRFDRVINEGLSGVTFSFIAVELIFPIMTILLDYLLIPYFLGVSVGKISSFLEYELSFLLQNLFIRYSYSAFLLLRVLYYVGCAATAYTQKKISEVRDTKYLLARELTNR